MTIAGRRLLLWDIDYTLVKVPGIGKTWYAEALSAFGSELHTHPDYSGRTERAITIDALSDHGIEPTEENIQRLWSELIRLSAASRSTFPDIGQALDGAAATLVTAAAHGAVQTLVTGNLPEISLHKCAAFGLDEHLDLEIGGYGTHSVHRHELVLHAVEAAEVKHGCHFAPEQVLVIGDTPNDVRAARDSGVIAVAVATGHHHADALLAAGAHVVLPDLADPTAVSRALLGKGS